MADVNADDVDANTNINPFSGVICKEQDKKLYPQRSDFTKLPYRDMNIASAVATSVKRMSQGDGTKVLFLPNDIRPLDRDFIYKIFMFGVMMDGSKALVILKNVPVYLDIRYPQHIIDNPNFDVASMQFIGDIRNSYLKNEKGYSINSRKKELKTVYGYPLKGFHTKPVPYLRIFFDNIRSRDIVLRKLQPYNVSHTNECKQPYELASNDSGNDYHNKISRDFKFFPCGWNFFTKARLIDTPNEKRYSNNCAYVFEVDINEFHAYDLEPKDLLTPRFGDDEAEIKRREARNVEITADNERKARIKNNIGHILEKDRTMVMAWDIETFSEIFTSATFKKPDEFNIFMICATFHWHHTDDALIKVCIVDKPIQPLDGVFTIVCDVDDDDGDNAKGNNAKERERKVMLAFMDVIAKMAPDHMCAFNGGGFDWNCVNIKLEHFGLMEQFKNSISGLILNQWEKKRFKTRKPVKIKISADQPIYEMDICDIPGIIDSDVMPVFKQLYTRSEIGRFQGLNFFAKKNKLGGKEDMPYKVMFAIYRGKRVIEYDAKRERVIEERDATPEENAVDMTKVAEYCVQDALLCQQLYAIRSIIPDKRELSNMSRVTLLDSFYKAGGSKVLNTLGFYCDWYDEQEDIRFNIMFDNHHHSKKAISYPGGYVPSPIYGLEKVDPVTGLDAASLYPSLQMTYNFSPDKTVRDEKVAAELEKKGYELHKVHVPVAHSTKNADGKEIVNVIDENGWVVRHSEHKPVNERLPGESMGIIPYILRKLFAERNKVKQEKIALSMIKETMEVEGKNNTNEFDDLLFRLNATDTKQKAQKVIMNTFYGKAGDSSSSIFEILVSGGITEMGQWNIKYVARLTEEIGCCRKYGDTDSIYITCPKDTYYELDAAHKEAMKQYGGGTDASNNYANNTPENVADPKYRELVLNYHNEKVRLTMKRIAEIRDMVNEALIKNNGTKYLKFAYEEVLYPVVFTGKKKYFGVAHEGEPKFIDIESLDDIFIRGVDIIKQGQTQLAKETGYEIMRDILNIFDDRSLMELVEEKIKHIYETKWDMSYFTQKLKYRPDKQNVRVLRFVERMRQNRKQYENDPVMRELYPIPNAGEPFECVVVKKEPIYTDDYRLVKQGVGDQMEYVDMYAWSQKTRYPMEIDLDYYMKGAIVGLFSRFLSYYPDFQSNDDATMIKKASTFVTEMCRKAQFGDNAQIIEQATVVKKTQRSLFTNTKRKFTKYIQEEICGGVPVISDFDKISADDTPPTHIGPALFNKMNMAAEEAAIADISVMFGKKFINDMIDANSEPVDISDIANVNDAYFDDTDDNYAANTNISIHDQIRIARAMKAAYPITLIKLNKLYGRNGMIFNTRVSSLKLKIRKLSTELTAHCGILFEIARIRRESVIRMIDDCNIEKVEDKIDVDNDRISKIANLTYEHRSALSTVVRINNDLFNIHRVMRKAILVSDALIIKLRQVDEQKFVQAVVPPPELSTMRFDVE